MAGRGANTLPLRVALTTWITEDYELESRRLRVFFNSGSNSLKRYRTKKESELR